MQVLAATTTSNTYNVILDISKSEVAMLAKKGASLVDQGGNYDSMNDLMISGCTSLGHGFPILQSMGIKMHLTS